MIGLPGTIDNDIACTAYMISSSATGVGLIINAAVILL